MVLLKIAVIFALVLVLLRLKCPFSIAILSTALALGFWFHLNLKGIGLSAIATLQSHETLSLAGIVGSILILSELLQSSGQLTLLSKTIVNLFGLYRLTYTILPAIIGLLPMPGGALFTAPLMDNVSDDIIPAHKKTLINYWFRHIWEYSWPLYPGLMLAASLAKEASSGKVDISRMALLQSIFTIVCIVVGLSLLFRGIKIEKKPAERDKRNLREFLQLIYLISPIALVIILLLAVNLDMLWCILISLGWLISTILITKKLTPWAVLKIIFAKLHIYQMMFIVASVLIFTGVLNASTIRADLVAFFSSGANNIPFVYLIISAIALPLIVGLLTGMTVAFVGITFPLIFAALPVTSNFLPWAMLAYVAGLSGTMLSPLHLCLALTTAYYGASLMKVYKYLIPIVLIVLSTAIIVFGIFMLV